MDTNLIKKIHKKRKKGKKMKENEKCVIKNK
jgi:hypothetical protein